MLLDMITCKVRKRSIRHLYKINIYRNPFSKIPTKNTLTDLTPLDTKLPALSKHSKTKPAAQWTFQPSKWLYAAIILYTYLVSHSLTTSQHQSLKFPHRTHHIHSYLNLTLSTETTNNHIINISYAVPTCEKKRGQGKYDIPHSPGRRCLCC